jgi:hypothetical protein
MNPSWDLCNRASSSAWIQTTIQSLPSRITLRGKLITEDIKPVIAGE